MPNEEISVDIILYDKTGKQKIDSATVVVTTDTPGEHTFSDLPAEEYVVDRILPKGHTYLSENPSKHSLFNEKNDLYIGIIHVGSSSFELGSADQKGEQRQDGGSESPVPEPVLVGAVLVTAAAIWSADVASFLGFTPPTGINQPQPAQSNYQQTNRSSNTPSRSENQLPPDLEARLIKCLEEAVKSQSDLLEKASYLDLTFDPFRVTTDPAKIAQYLINETQQASGDSEAGQEASSDPAIALISGLKKAVEDCDPELIQEIIEAEAGNTNLTIVNTSQTSPSQQIGEPSSVECCICVDSIPCRNP